MKRHRPLIASPLDWFLSANPVPPPAILVLAERGGTQLKTPRPVIVVDTGWRSEGPLPEEEHRAIFARSIARRAGVDEATVDVNFVVDHLNALYVFEETKIQVGAENTLYNVDKHSNDVYDAELLIYLADPTPHLLTSDKGFRRVEKSSQQKKVHIADADCLRDQACAERTIREMVEAITP